MVEREILQDIINDFSAEKFSRFFRDKNRSFAPQQETMGQSQGFPKLQKDAKDGGAVAGRTRKDIEHQTGKRVASRKNFLPEGKRKRLK